MLPGRGVRMGGVIRFERPIASFAVITKLVDLGYLQPGARHRATAVKRALGRLRDDLIRDGTIRDGDFSRSPKHKATEGSQTLEARRRALATATSTK
jgi:hypothetical protein